MTSKRGDLRPFGARIASPLARASLHDQQQGDSTGGSIRAAKVHGVLPLSTGTRVTDVRQETTDDE